MSGPRTTNDGTSGPADPQPPTAFPAPGAYAVPQMITLSTPIAGAVIRYTLDGTPPTRTSPLFDPYRLIPMVAFGEPGPTGPCTYEIRAATQVGERLSASATYRYDLQVRDRATYVSHELAPGLRLIRDFDDDTMYLVIGSRRALLIDAGMGAGDLRGSVEQYTGGLPLEVFITHGHPDHIARMGQFQDDCAVYMHPADLPLVERFIDQFGYEIQLDKILPVDEGDVFDLGDRRFRVFFVPGHSPGCLALLDEANRLLIAGDSVGSNRPTIVDALWMQFSEDRIDEYLSVLQCFRAKVTGKFDVTYGGHNDTAIIGERYLDHLEEAAQRLVDLGPAALTPSPRPSGVWQTVCGDRLTNPDWAAINVERERLLTDHPDRIATLSSLEVVGGRLSPEFRPGLTSYQIALEAGRTTIEIAPRATSRRAVAVRLDGATVDRGERVSVQLTDGQSTSIAIEVISPDGSVTRLYTVACVAPGA